MNTKAMTKDGRSVRIICTDRKFAYPVVGLIMNNGWEALACWDSAGHYNGDPDKNLDLVMK